VENTHIGGELINNYTGILATLEDAARASLKLQATNNKIDAWEKKRRIKINQSKPTHITFTLRNQTCPTVQMGNVALPQKNEVKYLGVHLDRRLTWAKHIKTTENSSTYKRSK
jgi:hypothetical protein